MKRKEYQEPTIKVVKLEQQCQLLDGSSTGQAGVQNYTVEDSQDW